MRAGGGWRWLVLTVLTQIPCSLQGFSVLLTLLHIAVTAPRIFTQMLLFAHRGVIGQNEAEHRRVVVLVLCEDGERAGHLRHLPVSAEPGGDHFVDVETLQIISCKTQEH